MDDEEQDSTRDGLTGLWKRDYFLQLANDLEEELRVSGGRSGVILVDVDNFKKINDEMGMMIGDAVLIEVAARLSRVGQKDDIITRIGGDEFVLLLPKQDSELKVKEASHAILHEFQVPIECNGHVLDVKVRVGAVISRPTES